MASLNFPPTTPGVSGPEYTLNGIVYYWDGEKWTANNEDGFTEVFVNVDGDNMTGDLTLGTDKITLETDGSSTFRGRFRNGAVDDNVTVITETGIIQSYRSTATPTIDCFQSFDSNNPGVPTGAWHSDGSIELSGTYQSDPNISLNADGSADFAGSVTSGVPYNNCVFVPGTLGTKAAGMGLNGVTTNPSIENAVYIDQFASSGTTATRVVEIKYDGSAMFAGKITAGVGVADAGVELRPTGAIVAKRNDSDVNPLFSGYNTGGTITSRVFGDGSATFDGNITAGNVTFNLEPDNDANYVTTTDVDEEGNTVETRVYNGPTLDVKERLTKADTALQTLKSAAAAAVDFAELKAAIATALVDI